MAYFTFPIFCILLAVLYDYLNLPDWVKRKRHFISQAMNFGFTEEQAEFLYHEFDDVKEI